jgi:glycine dehydrogenase subunit 1
VRRRCIAQGVNPGVDAHALSGREDDRGVLLVAITERRSRAEIDRLADVLGAAIAAERAGTSESDGGASNGASNGAGASSGQAAVA